MSEHKNITQKPTDYDAIIYGLEKSPLMLESFLAQIPEDVRKLKPAPDAWSIHEHAAHIVDVQPMLCDRFQRFKDEDHPVFKVFIPGKTDSDDHLYRIDLSVIISKYIGETKKLIALLKRFSPAELQKQGTHPEYKHYTPYILMRHLLMHNHLHMYRMEALWLTTERYR